MKSDWFTKDNSSSLEDMRNCYIELRQLDEDYN